MFYLQKNFKFIILCIVGIQLSKCTNMCSGVATLTFIYKLCFISSRNTAQKYGLHEFGIIMYIKFYRIILFHKITYINQSSELHHFCCLRLKFSVPSSQSLSLIAVLSSYQ